MLIGVAIMSRGDDFLVYSDTDITKTCNADTWTLFLDLNLSPEDTVLVKELVLINNDRDYIKIDYDDFSLDFRINDFKNLLKEENNRQSEFLKVYSDGRIVINLERHVKNLKVYKKANHNNRSRTLSFYQIVYEEE